MVAKRVKPGTHLGQLAAVYRLFRDVVGILLVTLVGALWNERIVEHKFLTRSE